ncbi:hypothetical protein F5Y18DRAFT_376617 [Xylariaceae sp. FL1019]|nr:hypothetical protein F5Y18DRAFT_376617 [Xylariaceae sp. FL1019]
MAILSNSIHWLVPTSIISGLLGGVLLATGHHFYYHSLDGATAESYWLVAGYRIPDQQFTLAIGTAFAFVVRSFLLFAISAAYVQMFWHAVRRARQGSTLHDIDALFSIFQNLLAFGRTSVWQKHPLLLVIALLGWLLPIAFIFPPATLSVIVTARNTSNLHVVPNFDFTSLRYVAGMPDAKGIRGSELPNGTYQWYETYSYNGPNSEVQRIATAVLGSGNILPITPPSINSTWGLDFFGPSISCSATEGDAKNKIERNIAHFLWNETNSLGSRNCEMAPGYLSWTSSANSTSSPFVTNGKTNITSLNTSTPAPYLHMAIMPDVFRGSSCNYAASSTPSRPLGDINATLLGCVLHNTSYHSTFSYESGKQNITSHVRRLEPVDLYSFVYGPVLDPGQYTGCFLLTSVASGPCRFDASVLPVLSYTAILDAFQKLVVGSVSFASFDTNAYSVDTELFSTALFDTKELAPLVDSVGLYDDSSDRVNRLQGAFKSIDASRGKTLSGVLKRTSERPLQDALEEAFQNYTISLISSDLLQYVFSFLSDWVSKSVTWHFSLPGQTCHQSSPLQR